VSNSSPLIHLTRLGKLGYMKKAFPFLMIPESVRVETIDDGKANGYANALIIENLEREGWLRTVRLAEPSSMKITRYLGGAIGKGEAEAIALALERNERLLIDDEKGRRAAELYGVETTSTLGIIFELLIEEILPREDYERNVKNYASQGWITSDVIQEFLDRGNHLG
jgi:uncharacterized protein